MSHSNTNLIHNSTQQAKRRIKREQSCKPCNSSRLLSATVKKEKKCVLSWENTRLFCRKLWSQPNTIQNSFTTSVQKNWSQNVAYFFANGIWIDKHWANLEKKASGDLIGTQKMYVAFICLIWLHRCAAALQLSRRLQTCRKNWVTYLVLKWKSGVLFFFFDSSVWKLAHSEQRIDSWSTFMFSHYRAAQGETNRSDSKRTHIVP